MAHVVQTSLDLKAPAVHDVGQLVALVPGPAYVLYAFPFVQEEQAVTLPPLLYLPFAHTVHVEEGVIS